MAKRWSNKMKAQLRREVVVDWREVSEGLEAAGFRKVSADAARKQWYRMQRRLGKVEIDGDVEGDVSRHLFTDWIEKSNSKEN